MRLLRFAYTVTPVYARPPDRVPVSVGAQLITAIARQSPNGTGHSSSFVLNPLDASDAAEGIHADLVFIDIDLPKIDGWELAAPFRTASAEACGWSRLPVWTPLHDAARQAERGLLRFVQQLTYQEAI